MNHLIFCSFEVGGFPYLLAKILNQNGVRTLYYSLGSVVNDHNSTRFHYGKTKETWDLSDRYPVAFSQNLFRQNLKIVKALDLIRQEYDIRYCFATGPKAYLLEKVRIPYNYWCYGSDLDEACFTKKMPWRSFSAKAIAIWAYQTLLSLHDYRHTLTSADRLMIAPYQKPTLDRVAPDRRLFFLPHVFENQSYPDLLNRKSQIRMALLDKIDANEYFFSGARHFWSGDNRSKADNKGNDIVIKAFAAFLAIQSRAVHKLVLVRKGPDVVASVQLADALGIGDKIVWVPEMKRSEIFDYYLCADFCFGQFGTPVLTFAALEPLSMGTPAVSYFPHKTPELPDYEESPPIHNERDPSKIAFFLYKTLADPDLHRSLGYRSWHWINQYCSESRFVRAFIDSFQDTAQP